MAYRIEPGESVADAVRRIAREELDAAMRDLGDDLANDPAEAIHDCRKRCKKIRGLVRIVRPALGNRVYRALNDEARDAATELSHLRDSSAAHETFSALLATVSDRRTDESAAALDAVEAGLRRRRAAAEARLDSTHDRVQRARAHLDRLATHVDAISFDTTGWDAIGPGFTSTYRRGHEALDLVRIRPTGQQFHRWRKSAKYTWHHVQLLSPTAPMILDPLAEAFHDLSGVLGEAHDLDLLADWMRDDDRRADDAPDPSPVLALTDQRRNELERQAIALGTRLYAERPKRIAARIGRYWQAWIDEVESEPTV